MYLTESPKYVGKICLRSAYWLLTIKYVAVKVASQKILTRFHPVRNDALEAQWQPNNKQSYKIPSKIIPIPLLKDIHACTQDAVS